MHGQAKGGAREELEKVFGVLGEIGRRAVADHAFREELKENENQVALMKVAGMTLGTLYRVALEHSVSQDELTVYGLALAALGHNEAESFVLSNTCMGTCKGATIWICGGCRHSFAEQA